MKINKIILTAGLFAAVLVSCTDLDVNPSSQYTEDPSKNSGVDPMIVVEAKMADVYFHLAGTLGRRYMEAQCLASDEFTCLAFDGGYYDDGTYAHQALLQFLDINGRFFTAAGHAQQKCNGRKHCEKTEFIHK